MKTLKKQQTRFLQLTMVFVMFAGTVKAQAKADFSGNWALDLGASSNPAKEKMRIMSVIQQPSAIILSYTFMAAESARLTISKDTLYMDGTAHAGSEDKADDFKLGEGKISGFTRTGTSKWSDDGTSLTISTDYSAKVDGKPVTFKTTEVWTMDDTGKKITINYTINYAGSAENYTYIYTHK